MKEKEILVTKNTGELQPFDSAKLVNSLRRSGAGEELVEHVLKEVTNQLYPGIPTRKIYRTAFSILRKKSLLISSQYKLKEAIAELGPTGYPFELLVARLFEKAGHDVSTGVLMKGVCLTHEIDVVAKKEKEIAIIECKFHNRSEVKSDVKVPLYINSRYQDIINYNSNLKNKDHFQGWLVTNTRFTEDAIQYAKCVGINLMGWDFPNVNNLKERIGASGLYPITTLTKLTKKEKALLIDKGIIFCEDIITRFDQVENMLHHKPLKSLVSEAENLAQNLSGRNG